MARKFNELRAKMSPSAQVKSQVMAQEILAQLPLQELRRAREYSQQTLADAMGVPQSAWPSMLSAGACGHGRRRPGPWTRSGIYARV